MFRLMDGSHAVKPSSGLLLMTFLVSRRHVNVLSFIVLIPSVPVRPIPCLAALGVLGPFHGPVWTFSGRRVRACRDGGPPISFQITPGAVGEYCHLIWVVSSDTPLVAVCTCTLVETT
jgi:hypothetical protein